VNIVAQLPAPVTAKRLPPDKVVRDLGEFAPIWLRRMTMNGKDDNRETGNTERMATAMFKPAS
jgi:hypothetical protein